MHERPTQTAARRAPLRAAAVAAALAGLSCGTPQGAPPAAPAGPDGWLEFDGTSNGTGTMRTIPLGDGRTGSVVAMKGTMLLAGPSRPGVGFLAESVALVDSATGLVGRSVWTDEHGDQVFSELSGQGAAPNARVDGTIVGGSGRYAGAAGSYTFTWQYVVEGEDGAVQGRAVGLHGRVRAGGPAGGRP